MTDQSTQQDPFERKAIASARKGDSGAYDYLVSKHAKRVLGIAAGLVRSRQDAEDLAQEAFVRAFRSLPRFREEEPFGPWIYRIVTNLALDFLRQKRRRGVEANQELREISVPAADDPESAASTRQLAQRIDGVIQSLPEMQRVVARLSLVEEFSHAEIAKMTGLSEGTVRSHLSHARTKLKEALDEYRRS